MFVDNKFDWFDNRLNDAKIVIVGWKFENHNLVDEEKNKQMERRRVDWSVTSWNWLLWLMLLLINVKFKIENCIYCAEQIIMCNAINNCSSCDEIWFDAVRWKLFDFMTTFKIDIVETIFFIIYLNFEVWILDKRVRFQWHTLEGE